MDENIKSGEEREEEIYLEEEGFLIGVCLTSLMSCLAYWCRLSVSVVESSQYVCSKSLKTREILGPLSIIIRRALW